MELTRLTPAWVQATAENIAEQEGAVLSTQDRWYILGMRAPRSVVIGALMVAPLVSCSATSTRARAVPTPPRPSGEAGKPAATVIADARRALLAATSVHVKGTFTAPVTQRLDLRLTTVNGAPAATGTVTTVTGSGAKTSTVTLALIRLGSRLYVRGDRAYYARIGPKAAAVAGHWLVLPTSQDASVANLTDLSLLAAGLSAASGDRVQGIQRLAVRRRRSSP